MSESSLFHLEMELDKLNACIHCGMCLPACPTYQVTGSEAESPRGRLYLMKELAEGALTSKEVAPHLEQCLACHGCETVCPSGVQYGKVLLATRADLTLKNHTPIRWFKRQIFRWLLPNHALLLAGGALLQFYQQSGFQQIIRRSHLLKLFPNAASAEALLPEIPHHRPLSTHLRLGDPTGETVALLVGCVMDVFYNPVHWDTIEVLIANGYQVIVPQQTCCGALAHHAGEIDITCQLAKRNINTMLTSGARWIVVNSAGCGSSMKEYPYLLANDPVYAEKARQFANKVVDITELLAKRPLYPFQTPIHETITYHAACHLYHVQKIKTQPVDLLSQIPGLTLVPLTQAEACCGSAGIFNVEHPGLSHDILNNKMETLRQACLNQGATTVATGNPGCMLQLEKGIQDAHLPLRVRHPISILADAYRASASAAVDTETREVME